jgi:lipoate-protein ligase A
MLFVDNEGITDPRVNLAIEEHLMRNLRTDQDILLFYINEPSVIIGRHQNTVEEIDAAYVAGHHIHVVRRLSGGGAVYHDLGNLNFSFITQKKSENIQNYRKFTEPVIRALRELGVQAELNGRNDIVIGERKISGNAQYVSGGRMVSHGTLLFNTDLSIISNILTVKTSKITSKGIKSVRSRVANISEFLANPMDMDAFRAHVTRSILSGGDDVQVYRLTAEDWTSIQKMTDERYRCWEWNFGASPEFNIQKVGRFSCGEIDARFEVEDGVIRSIRFTGDFLGENDPAGLEERLTGRRYTREDVEAAVAGLDLGGVFSGVCREEFVNFLCL